MVKFEVLIWAEWANCPENRSPAHIFLVLSFISFFPFILGQICIQHEHFIVLDDVALINCFLGTQKVQLFS